MPSGISLGGRGGRRQRKHLLDRGLLRNFVLGHDCGAVHVEDELDAPKHVLVLVVEIGGVVLAALQRGGHDLQRDLERRSQTLVWNVYYVEFTTKSYSQYFLRI